MKITKRTCAVLAVAVAVALASPAVAHDAHHHDHDQTEGKSMSVKSPDAAAFLAENDEAMGRMMTAMHVAPTGDVDRDFVAMMIPHHQGAIDMARAVLRSSRNEAVRRLAQEIIVTQEDEIRAMRLAIGDHAMPTAFPAAGKTEQDR